MYTLLSAELYIMSSSCVPLSRHSQVINKEQRMLGLQANFAMLFEEGGQYTFHLGKVQRLIRRVAGTRRLVEYREPVDIDNYDGPIYVVAVWYKPAVGAAHVGPSAGTPYELSTERDLASYDIQHVITPIHFQEAAVVADALEQRHFVLTPHDESAIVAAMAAVQRVEEKGQRTNSPRGTKRNTQFMEDDGRVTSEVAANSGRRRKVVSYRTS